MPLIIDMAEQSPCIVSKAKYALGLKEKPPKNNKKCTQHYWIKIVKYLAKQYGLNQKMIAAAIAREDLYR